MQTRLHALALCGLLVVAAPVTLRAQTEALDRAEALLRNGQSAQARAALNDWKKTGRADDRSHAARFAYLTARAAQQANEAEEAYLDVALNHPTSPYAAESLLRLGQARVAAGDATQAAVYLQRLLADYPRSEQRALASAWLARAYAASGRAQDACTLAQRALTAANQDNEAIDLLRAEQNAACTSGSARAASAAPTPAATQPPKTRTAPKPAAAAPNARGRYTIQVAAFRERAGAQTTVRQLERAGFEGARLVRVPDNALIRVRLGRFENSSAAATQLAKLKAAGFSALIVSDAQRESAVRD